MNFPVLKRLGYAVCSKGYPVIRGLIQRKSRGYFKMRLAMAKSNIPEYENGATIFEKFVKPALIDLKKVSAHYAVSSLFEEYIYGTTICSYSIKKEDYQKIEAGNTNLALIFQLSYQNNFNFLDKEG